MKTADQASCQLSGISLYSFQASFSKKLFRLANEEITYIYALLAAIAMQAEIYVESYQFYGYNVELNLVCSI